MALTYDTDGQRLIKTVRTGLYAGFRTSDGVKETLYAVGPISGVIMKRTCPATNKNFDGPGWIAADSVPGNAEWIGGYPIAAC